MSCPVSVAIHPSQFPHNVRRDLLESLRTRKINHKFHYDSHNQTQKWLALHQAYSPSRTDPNCSQVYDQSFGAAVKRIGESPVHLIGLGCGGGQKDARLLQQLQDQGRNAYYSPGDVSVAMVLVAHQTAVSIVGEQRCFPHVFDLAGSDEVLIPDPSRKKPTRLLTFFGMIPNFEPEDILPKLSRMIGRKDLLLFSANLAPGSNYAAGVRKILPLYDNALTRDWLQTFLWDLGVEKNDGSLSFTIEAGKPRQRLIRVEARFSFRKRARIHLPEESFEYQRGDTIRLFFSYRYTPRRLTSLLRHHGIEVLEQWITESGEEGVFLCRKPVLKKP